MSVTAAAGFRAAGVCAGLKSSGGRDVALVVNDGPIFAGAGVFTGNRVQAAPVVWSRQVVTDGVVNAVLLNSGGANACTGPAGFQDTHASAEHAGAALGISAGDVAVCSTGLIGDRLPMQALLGGVDKALTELRTDGGDDAALAIMTTDSVPKTVVASRAGWSVGGMAKGAGMLAPGLATMIVVITTDALATPHQLQSSLRAATTTTFDRIDSDGCMSTNDTVLLLASGASGVEPAYGDLADAVVEVCRSLARQLIADAEGAMKDIAIKVAGATDEDDAVEVGRAIARSNLLKCAIHGEDPNWGRILAAVGTTSATFDPYDLAVSINDVQVAAGGAACGDRSAVDMSGREVRISVDLGAGHATATIWTNDLTAMYVHENSAYST